MDELFNNPDLANKCSQSALGGTLRKLLPVVNPEWVTQPDFNNFIFYKVTLNPKDNKLDRRYYRKYLYTCLKQVKDSKHYTGIEFCKSGKMHVHSLMRVPKRKEYYSDEELMHLLVYNYKSIANYLHEGYELRRLAICPEWYKVYTVPLVIQGIKDGDKYDLDEWVKYVIKSGDSEYIRELNYNERLSVRSML